jgi:hypothetical protein
MKSFLFALFFFLAGGLNAKPNAHDLFKMQDSPFRPKDQVSTQGSELHKIATHALKYCETDFKYSSFYADMNSILFPSKDEYRKNMARTLRFLIKNLENETSLDPHFLNKHFHAYSWHGDVAKKLPLMPAGHIKLTKYPIFIVPGSEVKTKKYPFALYSLPLDEVKLSAKELEEKKDLLVRYQYTKDEILSGALDSQENRKYTKPLVWLSRDGLEEALMQGTVIVKIKPKHYKIFNAMRLTRGNTYSFFKDIGMGSDPNELVSKIHQVPRVTFAGDISNIGLSQFIAIKYFDYSAKKSVVQLGVLCDTGGAFKNNFHQLDYFMGPFESKEEFRKASLKVPQYVKAYILVKK